MQIIPARQDFPAYEERVVIDGTPYRLRFRWNSREESWAFDILTTAGVVLRAGIKVQVDWALLKRSHRGDLPDGDILSIDTSGAGSPPGVDELGDRVILVYTTEADAEAAA